MISIIHYISASRRLTESEKTVYMLGGEREAPATVLAQRDMIKLEKQYYYDKMIDLFFLFGITFWIVVFIWVVYKFKG